MSIFNRAPKAPLYETTSTLAMSAALTKKWGITPEVAEQASQIMRGTHDAALDIVAKEDNTLVAANDNTAPEEVPLAKAA